MSEHTKGQVKYRGCETLAVVETLGGREAEPIAHCGGPNALGNARRLAAAWNACEGFETDSLENILMLGDTMHSRFAALKAECDQAHRELTAARALLREVLESNNFDSRLKLYAKVQNYLDVCDTIGGGNG